MSLLVQPPPFDYTCWRKQKSNEKSSLEAKTKKMHVIGFIMTLLPPLSSFTILLGPFFWLVAWCTWSHWWPSSQTISAWYQVGPMSPNQLLRSNSPRILAMFFFWRLNVVMALSKSSVINSWELADLTSAGLKLRKAVVNHSFLSHLWYKVRKVSEWWKEFLVENDPPQTPLNNHQDGRNFVAKRKKIKVPHTHISKPERPNWLMEWFSTPTNLSPFQVTIRLTADTAASRQIAAASDAVPSTFRR